jgi:tetratricopeptide (TPR) repeat protein
MPTPRMPRPEGCVTLPLDSATAYRVRMLPSPLARLLRRRPKPAAPSWTPAVAPADAEGWVRLAAELEGVGRREQALAALDSGTTAVHTPAEAADVARLRTALLVAEGRLAEAHRSLDELIDQLWRLGRAEAADAEARLGLVLHGLVSSAAIPGVLTVRGSITDPALRAQLAIVAVRLLEESAERDQRLIDTLVSEALVDARAVGDRAGLYGAHLAMLAARASTGRVADIAHITGAMLALDLDRSQRMRVLRQRAVAEVAEHDAEHALADLDEAADLAEALEAPGWLLGLVELAADVAEDAGDREGETIVRLERAIAAAEALERPQVTALRLRLGRQLVRADRFAEGAAALDGALRTSVDAAPGPAARERIEALFWSGTAHRELGEVALSEERWAGAEALAVELGEHALAARILATIGNYRERDGEGDALDVLRRAVGAARRVDESPVPLCEALVALGTARSRSGDAAGIRDLDEAVALARAGGEAWLAADALDDRARALVALGHDDDGIRTALEASDAYRESGDPVSAGMSALHAAVRLHALGRSEEAAAALIGVLVDVAPVPVLRARACALSAAVFDDLGRTDEAAAMRALLA